MIFSKSYSLKKYVFFILRDIEVDIIEAEQEDYAQITKSKRFEFEWLLEKE